MHTHTDWFHNFLDKGKLLVILYGLIKFLDKGKLLVILYGLIK